MDKSIAKSQTFRMVSSRASLFGAYFAMSCPIKTRLDVILLVQCLAEDLREDRPKRATKFDLCFSRSSLLMLTFVYKKREGKGGRKDKSLLKDVREMGMKKKDIRGKGGGMRMADSMVGERKKGVGNHQRSARERNSLERTMRVEVRFLPAFLNMLCPLF